LSVDFISSLNYWCTNSKPPCGPVYDLCLLLCPGCVCGLTCSTEARSKFYFGDPVIDTTFMSLGELSGEFRVVAGCYEGSILAIFDLTFSISSSLAASL
jgi:hypothetical protein